MGANEEGVRKEDFGAGEVDFHGERTKERYSENEELGLG